VGVVGEVRFIRARTVYAALGDVVPWTSVAIVVAALLAHRRRPSGSGAARAQRR
jgi:hypothetical protein